MKGGVEILKTEQRMEEGGRLSVGVWSEYIREQRKISE